MRKDSIAQAFKVILGVSLVCSFLVSAVAVFLAPIEQSNRRLEKMRNILVAGGLYREGIDIEATYRSHIEPLAIDLGSGEPLTADRLDGSFDLDAFDIQRLAVDPVHGEAIPQRYDRAKIERRPRVMVVYFVRNEGGPGKVILPVYGKGLWSTMYGFLTLQQDLSTIAALVFYDHGETPGLGGEIASERWQRQWRGKRAYDAAGRVIIEVGGGSVDPLEEGADHRVAGLSGATVTSRGVDRLLDYWLGEHGYGPFLKWLRRRWNVAGDAPDGE